MSGRKRLIVAQVTERGLKGKALGDALYKELCQDEKSASYEKKGIPNEKGSSKK